MNPTPNPNPNETENTAEEVRLLANLDRRERLVLAQQEQRLRSQHGRRERQHLCRREAAAERRLWGKREAMARRQR